MCRVMRGDRSDLEPWPLGLPPRGDEDDLIELVLEGVHRGSKFRSPFLSATTSEAKAHALLREARTFRTRRTGPDPNAYLRRIDLSKLHPGQVIPFANHEQHTRLVQSKCREDRLSKFFARLGPGEVQPTTEAEKRSECLLVARGVIPADLFEEPALRARSWGP